MVVSTRISSKRWIVSALLIVCCLAIGISSLSFCATGKANQHAPLKGYSQFYDNGEPARPLPYRRLYPVYEKLSRPVIHKMLEAMPRLQALRDRLAASDRLEPADLHRPEDLQLLGAIASELSLQANALNEQLKRIADPMGPAAMSLLQQLRSWQETSEAVAQLQDAVGYWHEHDQTFRRYGLSDWQLSAGHADVLQRLDAALLQLGQLAQIERARRELNVISPP